MKKMRNQALLLLLAMLSLATFTTSCESEDEPETSIEVGETVKDFVKVTQYEDSKTFQNDLDALATYALDLHSFRLVWLMLVSNSLEDGKAFCATAKDLDKDEYGCGELLYEILDHILENRDTYTEALERLEVSGVLSTVNETRGVSDMIDFFRGGMKSVGMGRKSVIAVINEAGWGNNPSMLQDLYETLPSETRRGFSNATEFWKAYSKGEISTRSNVVFTTLYRTHPDFREKAMEMGVTPSRNIGIIGGELCKASLGLIIDCIPGSMGLFSSSVNYGKDIYNGLDAGLEFVTHWDAKTGKELVQNGLGNLVNYYPYLMNLKKGNGWQGYDLFDEFDETLGQGALLSIIGNYEDYFKEIYDGDAGIITNPCTVKDKNGKPIDLVVIQDEKTGKAIIGFPNENNGMIVVNPQSVGAKIVTVVNKQTGKRKTKVVNIDDDPMDITFDLEHDERLLEENPEKGILKLGRNPMIDEGGYGGNYKVMVETNYMYYTCIPDSADKWISARMGKDINYLYVTVAKNDTGKERTGHVTVAATDSKGKVLKTTVLTVKQTLPPVYEEWVDASPSSLKFDAKGGKKEVEITHSNALNYTLPVIGEELSSWCDLSWKETETGWNIVVEVDPNDTGKERSGTFTVYAANSQENVERAVKEGVFNKKVVQAVTVTVNQAADQSGGPSVSPTVLTVPSIGGALPVKVTFGDYTNSNWVLSNDAAKWITAGWNVDYLSPKRHTNQWYVIISPNDTKSARTDTLKIYFTKKENPTEKDRLYTPVVVKQEAGPYKLQDLSKLFVGTWYNPNEGPDNLGGYLYYRFTFNSNGSYTMETKYNKSKGADAGKWAVSQEGTYTVTSYKALTTCLRVNIQLTYKDSKGNKHTDNEICEMYPHFMRMVATYMERQE